MIENEDDMEYDCFVRSWKKMSKIISKLFVATILLAIIPVVSADVCNDNAQPSYASAIVDGNRSEWDENDIFVKMYEAGIESKTHLADLYLRYDCNEEELYVLVWAVNGTINSNENYNDDHYIKIGQSDKLVDANYVASKFQFINNSNGEADGWEAWINLPEDCYSPNNSPENGLNVHTQVNYSGEEDRTARPSHNKQIDLYIHCREVPIPEFSTIALPIAAILGLMFILQSRRKKED